MIRTFKFYQTLNRNVETDIGNRNGDISKFGGQNDVSGTSDTISLEGNSLDCAKDTYNSLTSDVTHTTNYINTESLTSNLTQLSGRDGWSVNRKIIQSEKISSADILPTIAKDDRWVGCGQCLETVHLRKDEGHLIWVDPSGILEVCLTYENTGQEFCCHINPQNSGVHIYRKVPNRHLILILDGNDYQEPWFPISSRQQASSNQYIKVKSVCGKVDLVLHSSSCCSVYQDISVFKFCYTITL